MSPLLRQGFVLGDAFLTRWLPAAVLSLVFLAQDALE